MVTLGYIFVKMEKTSFLLSAVLFARLFTDYLKNITLTTLTGFVMITGLSTFNRFQQEIILLELARKEKLLSHI